MKALDQPGTVSEQNPVLQNDLSKNDKTNAGKSGSTLFARLRRLEARTDNIELKASALRRDIDRVEKKLSRADLPLSLKEQDPGSGAQQLELDRILYGQGG